MGIYCLGKGRFYAIQTMLVMVLSIGKEFSDVFQHLFNILGRLYELGVWLPIAIDTDGVGSTVGSVAET